MKNIIRLLMLAAFMVCMLGATALADTDHTHYSMCTDADPTVCRICGQPGITNVQHRVQGKDNGDGTHLVTCVDCGYSWTAEHNARCTDADPSVCRICGARENVARRHAPENVICRDNGDGTHSDVCSACAAVLSTVSHWSYCNSATPNVCISCGAAKGVEVVHDPAKMIYTNLSDLGHSAACGVCGMELGIGKHRVRCTAQDKTVCADCGGKGAIELEHGQTRYVRLNEEQHQALCADCGQSAQTSNHYAECNAKDATVCAVCGGRNCKTEPKHGDVWYSLIDTETHTAFCKRCDAQLDRFVHTARCTADRSVCEACGFRYDTILVLHGKHTGVDNGDGTHTVHCAECGDLLEHGEHFAYCTEINPNKCSLCGARNSKVVHGVYMNGVCVECGQKKSESDGEEAVMQNGLLGYSRNGVFTVATGLVKFEGGLFLVKEGRIETDKNGLSKTEKGWYYFAGGQAQTQYTGFVQYDGAWFYVTGGQMLETTNGLYDYDGSKFLVSAGQVRYDYSGLFQNAAGNLHNADGKWYFIAGGQVQTQYTGLAEYDGHWFYLVSGVLAESYTGTVAYNGSEFQVVNGMVV